MPASLHASLMARLDRVPEVKEVAQVAACIGREFAYPLLAAVSPLPEAELRAALDRLAAAELVFRPRRAAGGELHLQARAGAGRRPREPAQGAAAGAARPHRPGAGGALPGDGGRGARAARPALRRGGARRAGGRLLAAGRAAGARALRDGRGGRAPDQGLEVLAGLPDGPERQRRELGLQLALGQASIAAKGFAAPETGRAYARARELCRELGDVPELFPALYGRFVVHFQRGELAAAHEVARELLRLAEERGDAAARVTGHRIVGLCLVPAREVGREPRPLWRRGSPSTTPCGTGARRFVYAIDSRVICLFWLSHVLLALGYPEQARARRARRSPTPASWPIPTRWPMALGCGCILHQLLRDRRERPGAGGGADRARDGAGLPALAGGGHGRPRMGAGGRRASGGGHRGDPPGLGRLRGHGGRAVVALLPGPARRGARAGGPSRGRPGALLAEALDRVERTGGRWIEAELHRLRGELLLALPEPDQPEAEACFRRALAVAREQGAKMWELRAATSLARLWRTRAGAPRRATCSPRSTAGSPRASTRRTCRTRRRCSTS